MTQLVKNVDCAYLVCIEYYVDWTITVNNLFLGQYSELYVPAVDHRGPGQHGIPDPSGQADGGVPPGPLSV